MVRKTTTACPRLGRADGAEDLFGRRIDPRREFRRKTMAASLALMS
jgi:hypothetical protein